MKNKIILAVLGVLMSVGSLSAQKTKYDYGTDSVSCVKNLFLVQEFIKQKNYIDAYEPWNHCVTECPKSRKSLYTKGEKMLKALIKEAKDDTKKAEYIDKLMFLYDTRIASFGREGYVLGKKGSNMYKYQPEKVAEAIVIMKKSIDMEGNDSKAAVISKYFSAIYNEFKDGNAPVETLLNEYIVVSEIINHNLTTLDPNDEKQAKSIKGYKTTKNNVDTYFIAVAECDDIVKLFKEKLEANPEDLELNKKALSIMNRKDCTDSELFIPVASFVHKTEPTWESAYGLGKAYVKKRENSKALPYFEQAIELCGDCSDKEALVKSAGLLAISVGKTGKAQALASQLLKINPNNGTAYIIKGDIIRKKAGACGADKLSGASVYWLAADYYSKAKAVDSSEKTKATANKRLGICANHYPTKEDLFFIGLKAGDSYTVPCVGEKTTIRKSN